MLFPPYFSNFLLLKIIISKFSYYRVNGIKNWCDEIQAVFFLQDMATELFTTYRSLLFLIFMTNMSSSACGFFFFFSIYLFIYFPFIFISWRLITLQYCSGFCHTLTWISHGFTCVPHPHPPSRLPPHPIPLGLPSAPALSTCLMHPTWAGDLFHPW